MGLKKRRYAEMWGPWPPDPSDVDNPTSFRSASMLEYTSEVANYWFEGMKHAWSKTRTKYHFEGLREWQKCDDFGFCQPASWATRVTSDPTDATQQPLPSCWMLLLVWQCVTNFAEGGEKHRAFIKGKTNKQKSEYDGKFFILSVCTIWSCCDVLLKLQKIKTNFLQHWELNSKEMRKFTTIDSLRPLALGRN